mgnify:FL=1
MLNDGYAEHIVKGKTPAGVMMGMIAGAVLIVVGVAGLFIPQFVSLGVLVVIIGGVIFGVCISRKDTEYEYIMVNEDVDVARIIAKKSRKKMCSFSNNDVKFIAKSDSIYLDNELQQDSSIRTRDYTSHDPRYEDGVYVFVLNKNGKTEFVKLELSDKTIDHVNNFFKGKYKE